MHVFILALDLLSSCLCENTNRFTAEAGKTSYAVTARPEGEGIFFYADQTGAVHRSEDSKPADASSPQIQ